MPVFYPSLVFNLKLKFDESLTLTPDPELRQPDKNIENPPETTSFPSDTPLIVQRGQDNVSFVMNRVPVSASIELPGYRQAGKFSAELDWTDIPIDPRTVRSAAVEVHMGSVPAADFADGMAGAIFDGQRVSIITTRDEFGQPNPNTLKMVGFVDVWNSTHDDGGSHVSIEGRDLRSALLDTKLGTSPQISNSVLEQVDTSKPIDEVVRDILDIPGIFELYTVEVNPAEWPNGTLPSPGGLGELAPRHRKGARGSRRGGRATQPGGSNSMSYWDLIVKLCYAVGAIPHFVGYSLRIRPTRSIFDQLRAGFDPANPTPFLQGKPRDIDAVSGQTLTQPLTVRRLVYGRDIKSLTFRRKFGGLQRPKAVRVVGVNESSTGRGISRQIEARYPPAPEESEAARAANRTHVSPGPNQAREEIINVPVAGIQDVDRLRKIAEAIYEEIGRGEMGGTIETDNLASFGGSNQDPDLLKLHPGDGMEVLVDVQPFAQSSPVVSEFTDFHRTSFAEQVKIVEQHVGDENLARVIVATSRGQVADLQIQRFFRVANVSYRWSNDNGVGISFDFQNYVVARQQLEEEDQEVILGPTIEITGSPPGSVNRRNVPFDIADWTAVDGPDEAALRSLPGVG